MGVFKLCDFWFLRLTNAVTSLAVKMYKRDWKGLRVGWGKLQTNASNYCLVARSNFSHDKWWRSNEKSSHLSLSNKVGHILRWFLYSRPWTCRTQPTIDEWGITHGQGRNKPKANKVSKVTKSRRTARGLPLTQWPILILFSGPATFTWFTQTTTTTKCFDYNANS